MNKKVYLTTGACLLSMNASLIAEELNDSNNVNLEKPNIIYILADDLGIGDLSCLNSSSKISTPNMDNLARQGKIFSNAHSCSAVSTPSRYGILTGAYNFRSGLESGVLSGYDKPLIKDDDVTIAEKLQEAGYRTACIGKWHLGLDFQRKDNSIPLLGGNGWSDPDFSNVDFTGNIKGGPESMGFDTSWYFPASLDISPYVYISQGRVTAAVVSKYSGASGNRFMRSGAIAEDFDPEKVIPTLVDKSRAFIADAGNSPFFLYLALPSPHTPYLPDQQSRGKSKAGDYGDYVIMTDTAVGQITTYLRDAGLEENTIVILTSDNGAWRDKFGETDVLKNKFGHLTNGIYRGQKSDLYEGGHRVPFLVKWPAVIEAGTSSQELMSLVDFYATAVAVTGQTLQGKEAPDSFNMVKAFKGEEKKYGIRGSILYHSIDGEFAVVSDDWKYIDCKGSGGWTSRLTLGSQLYNLNNDIYEEKNLLLLNSVVKRRLRKKLNEILSSDMSRPML